MVDIREALPELDDPEFNRDLFMTGFDEPHKEVNFLINVMSRRHFWSNESKSIQLQDVILGVKKDDGFDGVLKYIFTYINNNNPMKSERERLLYMYVLSDEIKCGIDEFDV